LATGNPKTKWNNQTLPLPLTSLTTSGVQLGYEGKISEDKVLTTVPAVCSVLWQKNNSPVQNRLYYGDNLPLLAHLLQDPTIRGKVKLIYIDPPFASGGIFQSRSLVSAYADVIKAAEYIEFIRQRLILLRELLAPDGSIYVHLDENMAFHIKLIMDEVFGIGNFRNWITRKKCNPKNYTRKTYGNISDYILFYTKSDEYVWNRPFVNWNTEHAHKEYAYVEPETGRRYKKVPIHAPGERKGETGTMWRGMLPPPGKHWQYTPKTLEDMDKRGEIYWSPNGNPRRKVYLDESEGIPVQDIWLEYKDAHNQNIQITGYPTEKPPALLERIIQASSNPGDLVLDCFSGSGTTLDVASNLARNWLGIDNSIEAICTTLKRFVHGLAPMGDFVNKATLDETADSSYNQLSFEHLSIDKSLVNLAPREAFTNFTLYASNSYNAGLEVRLEEWIAKLQEIAKLESRSRPT
jgi:adenine-specific DNA-methyltransferase